MLNNWDVFSPNDMCLSQAYGVGYIRRMLPNDAFPIQVHFTTKSQQPIVWYDVNGNEELSILDFEEGEELKKGKFYLSKIRQVIIEKTYLKN